MNLKQILSNAVKAAIDEAQREGSISQTALPEILIEHPQNVKHGDYASSAPLKIARAINMPPMDVADRIKEFIPELNEIASIDVSPPGFINFVISNKWLMKQIEDIYVFGSQWGKNNIGNGEKVQIEFVSVNPTGPLHVGHGRGAVIGSTLANLFKVSGFNVEREYYINDAGNQLDAFRRTLFARYKQNAGNDVPLPEDGYFGNYMIDLAKEINDSEGKRLEKLDNDELILELGEIGIKRMLKQIEDDLKLIGVEFDVWFSERSLRESGLYNTVVQMLEKNNHLDKREKALWLVSSALGEDKDNVLVRSDGTPTYFAYDIAYHYQKFVHRKFDTVIDIWGADHQGHVSRMKTAIGALGINPDKLKILICQLVTLKRGNEIVRVSKRSGDLITLKEVVNEVGPDACRFVFLSRSADSQMDFDLELAKKQSNENPVYYVQYAYARIASILRLAEEKHIDYSNGDVNMLDSEWEISLIKKMVLLPEIIETALLNLAPQHLPYYAMELATEFHVFYKQCRVITEDEKMTAARLKLVKSAQVILGNILNLMGMNAPETM
jgi:arginyl-tRNA synthetase